MIDHSYTIANTPLSMAVADLGEVPRGTSFPLLFLDQTEARTAQKNFFGDGAPPPLSQGLDDWVPPYLKVWIR